MPQEIKAPEIKPLDQIYAQRPVDPQPAEQPPADASPPVADQLQPSAGNQPAEQPPADASPPVDSGSPEARAREDLERRDRELFQRETWLSQRMNELKQYEQVRQLARENPAEAARILGIDTLRLAEGLMGGGQQEPAQQPGGDKVLEYIKSLEEKIHGLESGFSKQNAVGEIKSALSTSRDQYAMLSAMAETNPGLYDQLHELKKQYSSAGRNVELKEIFDQQEDFYTQSMLQSLTKILSVPKLKEKVAELINKQPGAANKPLIAPAQPTPRTLRNGMQAEPPSELPRPTTPEEAAAAARKIKLWAD